MSVDELSGMDDIVFQLNEVDSPSVLLRKDDH